MISRFSFIRKSCYITALLLVLFSHTAADTTLVDSVQSTPLISVEISSDTISFGDTVEVLCKPTVDSLTFTLQKPEEWQKFSTVRLVETQLEGRDTKVSFALSKHALCTIPALIFSYPLSDSTTDTVSTGDIVVTVLDVLPTDEAVVAIEGKPMKAGTFPYWIVVVVVAGIVVFILLLLFGAHIITFINSFLNREQHVAAVVPAIPPYEEAVQRIVALEAKEYLGKGAYKEYTFELSDILKCYIGRRYECLVHESTSTEFRAWITGSGLEKELQSLLNSFINETDPVKFANLNPGTKTLLALLDDVKGFVESTKPIFTTDEESTQSESEVVS